MPDARRLGLWSRPWAAAAGPGKGPVPIVWSGGGPPGPPVHVQMLAETTRAAGARADTRRGPFRGPLHVHSRFFRDLYVQARAGAAHTKHRGLSPLSGPAKGRAARVARVPGQGRIASATHPVPALVRPARPSRPPGPRALLGFESKVAYKTSASEPNGAPRGAVLYETLDSKPCRWPLDGPTSERGWWRCPPNRSTTSTARPPAGLPTGVLLLRQSLVDPLKGQRPRPPAVLVPFRGQQGPHWPAEGRLARIARPCPRLTEPHWGSERSPMGLLAYAGGHFA